MSRITKKNMIMILVLLMVGMFSTDLYAVAAGDSAVSPANTMIYNGFWDGSQAEASAPGEMTLQIGSVFSGVHNDSALTLDSFYVDSVYAFSSLESLDVQDQSGIPNYDTVYYQYIVQNYGNVASDSFGVMANIVDTTNATTHFPVTDFDITDAPNTGATVISWATGGGAVDTTFYGMNLAEGARDTFYIRVVVPSLDSAVDGDDIDIAIRIRNQSDVGTYDAWPDTVKGTGFGSARRVVVDTFGTYLHTGDVGSIDSCLFDFGDIQLDTVNLAIGAPTIRLAKAVTRIGFSGKPKPGDTLVYTIKYDNDGSGATTDPAYIVDQLPSSVTFLSLASAVGGNGNTPTMELEYGTGWNSHVANDDDSLRIISALRFTVPSGLDADDNVGENADNTIADDSTGHANDGDAGMIKFRVRVR